MQISTETKLTRCSNAVAAGTSAINGTGVNMANFDGVRFIFAFGAIVSGAATSVKLQQSSDDGSADDYTDLEGTSITIADTDDNKIVSLEVNRPTKQYVRPVVVRGTQNATLDSIVAEQYGPRVRPTTNDTTTNVTGESHASPAEGTA